METKRKLTSDAELLSLERSLSDLVTAVRDENAPRFDALGYELELKFESSSDDAPDVTPLSLDDGKKYDIGYVSQAVVTVKHKKTDDDVPAEEPCDAPAEATDTVDEDDEQRVADETFAKADAELKRSVAFTRVMLIRIYKTFWVEKVSRPDSDEALSDSLSADLDEFYDKLASDAQ